MELFGKKSIGLDISNKTIEVTELEKGIDGIKVLSLGRTILNSGIVENGRIRDQEKLSEAIKKTLTRANPHPIIGKKIVFGLPESQAYTYFFKLGEHNEKERNDLISEEAYKNIPLGKDDLLFSYKILKENENNLEILLIATSKKIVSEWQEFFNKMGLEVVLFDFESLAIFRGIFAKSQQTPVCIIDIGAFKTNINIFNKNGLYYSHSIDLAGNVFTQEIAKSLNIELEEAEKIKIEIGLKDENHKIFSILTKQLEIINNEVKILIDYFEKKTNQKIKNIILVGGSSRILKISDYFNINLGITTKIGQSFLIIKEKIPLEYIESIGLALRRIDKKWSQTDPVLKPLNQDFKERIMPDNEKIQDIKGLNNLNIKIKPEKIKFSRKKLLIIILIFGIILIGLAYLYKNNKENKEKEEMKIQLEELDNIINKNKENIIENEIENTIEREFVLIKETEIGWLNVRKGASIDYPILTKIYPGESYPLLNESEKWYKIELNNGQEGWIFNEYTSKQ